MRSIRTRLKHYGKKLFFCDMRPGFAEDGVEISLPKGDYKLSIEPVPNGPLRGFSLVLPEQTPDAELPVGTFSIEMARVGVFDPGAFSKLFAGDWEALFEWSADDSGQKESEWGGVMRHKKSGLEALYVKIGSDCECAVRLLRSHSHTVGVRVIPIAPPERHTDKLESRRKAWVDLKCQGIGRPWAYCDDRNYELDFDLLLDNVLFDVSSITDDSLDPDAINPDRAISHYAQRYKGVSKVSVYYQRTGERQRPIRLSQSQAAIPKLGSQATPRKIAKVVFNLFKHARQMA